MDLRFQNAFREHEEVMAETRAACFAAWSRMTAKCRESLESGGKILFFGNGGSAADAQHLAAELTIRYVKNRKAMAAIALTTDTSAITACANDFGYEHVFSRQLEALGRTGDVAVAISTSGNSPSILRAAETARQMGIFTVGLTGRTGGQLASKVDLLIAVPSDVTARIQEMHSLLGHLLCEELEG